MKTLKDEALNEGIYNPEEAEYAKTGQENARRTQKDKLPTTCLFKNTLLNPNNENTLQCSHHCLSASNASKEWAEKPRKIFPRSNYHCYCTHRV
jgi:hypothetical protein